MCRGPVVMDCDNCDGSGLVPDPESDGFLDAECTECWGEGWIEVEAELR